MKETISTKLVAIISKHPETGIFASIMAAIAPYLDALTDIGKFIAVVLGCIVSGATAYIKVSEAIKIRKSKNK